MAPIANEVIGHVAPLETKGQVVRTNDDSGESPLGNLIADAQRTDRSVIPDGGQAPAIAFMNPGGIRADIQSGEVTYGELFTVQPFDNQVVRMELTGEQIYRLLEQQFTTNRILQISGFEYSYNSAEKRIVSVTLPDGSTLPRDGTVYTVAANSFIATGGDGFTVFKEGRNVQTLGSDLDALEAHVENLPQPFSAPADAQTRITKEG